MKGTVSIDLEKLSTYFSVIDRKEKNYKYKLTEGNEGIYNYLELEKKHFSNDNRAEILYLVNYLSFAYQRFSGIFYGTKQLPYYLSIPADYKHVSYKDLNDIRTKVIERISRIQERLSKEEVKDIENFIDYRYRYVDLYSETGRFNESSSDKRIIEEMEPDDKGLDEVKYALKNNDKNAPAVIDDLVLKPKKPYIEEKQKLMDLLSNDKSHIQLKFALEGNPKSKYVSIKNTQLIQEIEILLKKKFQLTKKDKRIIEIDSQITERGKFIRNISKQLKSYLEAETEIPINTNNKKHASRAQALFIGYFLSACGFFPSKDQVIQNELRKDEIEWKEREVESFIDFYLGREKKKLHQKDHTKDTYTKNEKEIINKYFYLNIYQLFNRE